jgi:UDP-glucose 4-epimerase
MNVLITGGAGFIGSHLAQRCLAEGWNVDVLDNLSTGAMENIIHLKGRSSFSYRVESILNQPLVAEMVDSADIIFHLAAAVGVQLVIEKPVETIETNVDGTTVVLRCAAKKAKRVLLASTSEVYGKSTSLPFREDANLVLGSSAISRWGYAASKALDEWLAMAYWHQCGLPLTVVRLFNTVGPRQTGRYGMVLPRFVCQALRGEPLTVHETGDQQRCFSYVGDVVEALVRLAQSPAAIGEVVNIGNDQEVSMNELAAMVREVSGSPSFIQHVPYDRVYGPEFEDMPRRVPCLEKLERLIHYRPTTTLESIIRRVVDYEWVHMEKRTMHATV